MDTELCPETVVASVEGFIHSLKTRTETSTIVHTIAGIGVEASDNMWRPVREEINGRCYSVNKNEVRSDPDYWDGEARVSMVEVHHTCPGRASPHYCSVAPIPVGVALGMRSEYEVHVWLTTGQFPR